MKFQQLWLLVVAAPITFNFILVVSSDPHQLGLGLGLRGLKSFKEKGAVGTNITFDCSPSGPCVPCLYDEKKDVSYRCSETGYRIPMTCVKTAGEENNKHQHKDSSKEIYVTYRSCIPALTEENLSLLAFEALMLLLLVSTSFVIFRRKRSLVMPMPGPIRLPTTNPRF